MKVKDLIERLSELDPQMDVIVQKDSEGNDYSPLVNLHVGVYVPETTYSGSFYDHDDEDLLLDNEGGSARLRFSVVLVPTN